MMESHRVVINKWQLVSNISRALGHHFTALEEDVRRRYHFFCTRRQQSITFILDYPASKSPSQTLPAEHYKLNSKLKDHVSVPPRETYVIEPQACCVLKHAINRGGRGTTHLAIVKNVRDYVRLLNPMHWSQKSDA